MGRAGSRLSHLMSVFDCHAHFSCPPYGASENTQEEHTKQKSERRGRKGEDAEGEVVKVRDIHKLKSSKIPAQKKGSEHEGHPYSKKLLTMDSC